MCHAISLRSIGLTGSGGSVAKAAMAMLPPVHSKFVPQLASQRTLKNPIACFDAGGRAVLSHPALLAAHAFDSRASA